MDQSIKRASALVSFALSAFRQTLLLFSEYLPSTVSPWLAVFVLLSRGFRAVPMLAPIEYPRRLMQFNTK